LDTNLSIRIVVHTQNNDTHNSLSTLSTCSESGTDTVAVVEGTEQPGGLLGLNRTLLLVVWATRAKVPRSLIIFMTLCMVSGVHGIM
jgi:hypothetical protein